MRAGTKLLIPLLGVLTGLLVPATGQATVTIGSDLSATPTSSNSCAACTLSNVSVAPERQAPGGFAAPGDGVVVRWRVKSGAAVAPLALRLLNPGSSSTRTGAGTGAEQTPTANAISTFDERLPIKAGDVLGIQKLQSSAASVLFVDPANPRLLIFDAPNLADGEPARMGTDIGPYELLINADIEPDVNGDGFGDETQDDPPETTITKKPKRKGTKKRVVVGFSSNEMGSTFECKLDSRAFKPCQSPNRFKAGKGRHVFSVRAVDAVGNADATPAVTSFRIKAKKKR